MIPPDVCGTVEGGDRSRAEDGDEANDGVINSGRLPFAVDSVKVNCDGTKASLLFATVGHTAVRSTLAVYDLDTDGYRTFDFKVTGRAPETHAWVRLFVYLRMGN